jgi:hypothetical protein
MPATGKTYSTGLSIINQFNLVDCAEILVCVCVYVCMAQAYIYKRSTRMSIY